MKGNENKLKNDNGLLCKKNDLDRKLFNDKLNQKIDEINNLKLEICNFDKTIACREKDFEN